MIPKGCDQQDPDCEKLYRTNDMASSTNTLSNEKWRGNLLFRKDLITCMDFDSDGKICDNLGNLDTN